MNPPPIRYPLPIALALLAIGGLVWCGADILLGLGGAVGGRVSSWLAVPYPNDADPAFTAGPLPRKALVLRDGTPLRGTPGGEATQVLERVQVVDLLNAWPPSGEPTAYRVGNPGPLGWVASGDLLPWDTRLVLRRPQAIAPLESAQAVDLAVGEVRLGEAPLPVVAVREGGRDVEVVVWDPKSPWRSVAGRVVIRVNELPAGTPHVLVTRRELLELIRRSLKEKEGPDLTTRAATIGGTLLDADPAESGALLEIVRDRFGPLLEIAGRGTSPERSDGLARLNEDWRPDVSWNGVPLRAVPLRWIP